MKKIVVLMLSVWLFMVSGLGVQAQENGEEYLELVDALIEAETGYGLSGVQLYVLKDGEVVKDASYGYTNNYENVWIDGVSDLRQIKVLPISQRTPVTPDTLFDLASNTKMYATNYAIQYLIYKGEITLETKIVDIYPEYSYQGIGIDGQNELNIGHLLRHDSGFIASPKYHDNTFLGNLGNGDKEENYLYTQNETEVLEKLLVTPLEYEPGTKVRYSDVDFMLLGKIVETISGKPLNIFLSENIYKPLGITNVMFNPLEYGVTTHNIAATELHGNTRDGRVTFNNYRSTVIQGQVHDEKAYHSFAGVAGHAGLFGNAKDVARLANLMLTQGSANGVDIFSQETIEDFSRPSEINDTYSYGWRRQGDNLDYAWAFSPYASKDTLGHTGWTGTITLIDPSQELVIVLLTNARNTPIMGPDKNDFYTKSFRTNDYGTITTLIYESLGLGSGVKPSTYIIELLKSDIQKIDNQEDTVSLRNELRSLFQVLNSLALEDFAALEFLEKDEIKSYVSYLDEKWEEDSIHLDTSIFDEVDCSILEAIDSINKYNPSLYTYATYLSDYKNVTQKQIDAFTKLLKQDKGYLLLEKAKEWMENIHGLIEEEYTIESWNTLKEKRIALVEYLSLDNYNLNELETVITELEQAYENLSKMEIEIINPEKPKEESNNSGSSKDKDVNGSSVLPATGVSSMGYSGILLGVGAIGLVYEKLRNREI